MDRPLLYYSQKLAKKYNYEIKLLTYDGFPEGVRGNKEKMIESFNIALEASRRMLSDVDMDSYDDILFIGKSVGTVVATKMASELYEKSISYKDKLRAVLYTPLEATFRYNINSAIAFSGTSDPWVGGKESVISKMCHDRNINCITIEEANHSLETGDIPKDIENLKIVLDITEKYIINE